MLLVVWRGLIVAEQIEVIRSTPSDVQWPATTPVTAVEDRLPKCVVSYVDGITYVGRPVWHGTKLVERRVV